MSLFWRATTIEDLIQWRRLIKRGDLVGIRALLAAGEDVNCRNRFDWTPLMLAAGAGRTEIVECLLAHEADVSAINNVGASALAYAVLAGHVRTMEVLLSAGAPLSVMPHGVSLIEFARWGAGNSRTRRHVDALGRSRSDLRLKCSPPT